MITELNNENFERFIASSTKPVLVDFWASWCSPCRMQAPIIDELSDELSDKIIFAKVNVDDNNEIAEKLQISSIPTLFLYVSGQLKEKLVGLTSKPSLSEMLIKYI